MALKETLQKIPKPVLIVGAGVVIGGGLALSRRGKATPEGEPTPGEPVADAIPQDAYSEEGYGFGSMGPVYAAPAVEPAETVGAVGQTALEAQGAIFSEFITSLPELIAALRPPDTSTTPADIPQSAPPPPASATVVAAPTPAQPKRPPGYHDGGHVRSGSANRNFSGASGWAEISTPNAPSRDFHVAYPNHVLQRWRFHGANATPKSKRNTWDKIWEGRWG